MIGDEEDLKRAREATDLMVDKTLDGWGNPCTVCGIIYTNPETDLCVWHDMLVSEAEEA